MYVEKIIESRIAMSIFISYAQNFEDVVLFRALQSVEKGFYVDVGANDPKVDSVTHAFYERGWRGINIEPVKFWFNALKESRPEDKNFRVAAGARNEISHMYEVVGTGLSTEMSEYAERYRQSGWEIKEEDVPCRRLDEICDECGLSEIHFLKIDVEGAERRVLEGIDLNRLRPWIVVIESTEPGNKRPTYGDWEDLLVERRYTYAYFDGLNRFYIANEHWDHLYVNLAIPPNVFDHFVRHSEQETTLQTGLLGHLANEAIQRARATETEASALRESAARLREDVAKFKGALSQQRIYVANLSAELTQNRAESKSLLNDVQLARRDREKTEYELIQLQGQMSSQEAELIRLQEIIRVRDIKIQFLRNTVSWRITAPVRWIGHAKKKGSFHVPSYQDLDKKFSAALLGCCVAQHGKKIKETP